MSKQEVAKTIIAQMGGAGRIMAMTGTKQFVAGEDSVTFRFPNKRGPNMVAVLLDGGTDTYFMHFFKTRGSECTLVAKHEGVYAEDLKPLFEKETGLYLSF